MGNLHFGILFETVHVFCNILLIYLCLSHNLSIAIRCSYLSQLLPDISLDSFVLMHLLGEKNHFPSEFLFKDIVNIHNICYRINSFFNLSKCMYHSKACATGRMRLSRFLSGVKVFYIFRVFFLQGLLPSSWSCHAASTDIPDPLTPLFPIVHRLW